MLGRVYKGMLALIGVNGISREEVVVQLAR